MGGISIKVYARNECKTNAEPIPFTSHYVFSQFNFGASWMPKPNSIYQFNAVSTTKSKLKKN